MIGKLKGIIDTLEEDHVIIDVNGVGYVVYCSSKTLAQLPSAGEATILIIETHVREDHIHLYGFQNAVERDWFRLLVTVQGVGVRMGLAILGTFSPDQIANTIAAQDKKMMTQVSGVGPKLAERIITELKNKVASLPTSTQVIDHPTKTSAAQAGSGVSEDAVSALVNLGYGRSEAFAAIARISNEQNKDALDILIREGLKELAS
ncbi:MAG: Holliday junction branch migration protein RuvA [Rickettsiales bacterium]|nr:Holliday junction branch migration protein RuvA [Rickettsiales bacterium]